MEKQKHNWELLTARMQKYAVNGLHLFAALTLIGLNVLLVAKVFAPFKYGEQLFLAGALVYMVGVAGFCLSFIVYRLK